MNTRTTVAITVCSMAALCAGIFFGRWSVGARSESLERDRSRPDDVAGFIAAIDQAGRSGSFRPNRKWDAWVGSLQPADLPVVLTALDKVPESSARFTLERWLFSRWGEFDPAAAVAAAQSLAGRRRRWEATEAALGGWAVRAPGPLMAWARGRPPGALREQALAAAAEGIADSDPREAFALAREAGLSEGRLQLVDGIFSRWAALDPLAAAKEAASALQGPMRTQVLESIVAAWMESGVDSALAWIQTLPSAADQGTLLLAALERLAITDPKGAATRAMQLDLHGNGPTAVSSVLARWAKQDRPAALAWVEKLEDRRWRATALMGLVASWASTDPAGARAYVRKSSPEGSRMLEQVIVQQWAAQDPEGAMTYVLGAPPAEGLGRLFGETFLELARKDIRRAFERLPEFSDDLHRTHLGATLIGQFVRQDPDGALAYIRGVRASEERNRLLHAAAHTLAQEDARLAGTFALALPPGQQQMEAVIVVTTHYVMTDPKAAADWVAALPDGDAKRSAIPTVAGSLAHADLRAAIAFSERLSAGAAREAAIIAIASQWASRDPSGAAGWVLQWPDDVTRSAAIVKLAQAWAMNDAAASTRFAHSLPPGETRLKALQSAIGEWSARDPRAAWQWVAQLADSPERAGALERIAPYLMNQGTPEEAARLLQTFPSGPVQLAATRRLADRWAAASPFSAAAWIAPLPEGELRADVVQRLVAKWSASDPHEASRWLLGQPEGQSRDRAAQSMVAQFVARSPELAAPWAGAISNLGQRADSIETVARAWLAVDRGAAEAWLMRSGLPADRMQRLLRP